jgi:hypothetical protein
MCARVGGPKKKDIRMLRVILFAHMRTKVMTLQDNYFGIRTHRLQSFWS